MIQSHYPIFLVAFFQHTSSEILSQKAFKNAVENLL